MFLRYRSASISSILTSISSLISYLDIERHFWTFDIESISSQYRNIQISYVWHTISNIAKVPDAWVSLLWYFSQSLFLQGFLVVVKMIWFHFMQIFIPFWIHRCSNIFQIEIFRSRPNLFQWKKRLCFLILHSCQSQYIFDFSHQHRNLSWTLRWIFDVDWCSLLCSHVFLFQRSRSTRGTPNLFKLWLWL